MPTTTLLRLRGSRAPPSTRGGVTFRGNAGTIHIMEDDVGAHGGELLREVKIRFQRGFEVNTPIFADQAACGDMVERKGTQRGARIMGELISLFQDLVMKSPKIPIPGYKTVIHCRSFNLP